MATDLITLDKKIALAVRALDAWRAEIAVDDRRDDDDVIAPWGELTKRATIEAIASSSAAPFASIETLPTLLLPSGAQIALGASRATAEGVQLASGASDASEADDPLARARTGAVAWCVHLAIARLTRDATVARAAVFRDEREAETYGRVAALRSMLRSLARPKQAGGVPEPKAAIAIEDLSPQTLDAVVDDELRRREAAESFGGVGACCARVDASVVQRADEYLKATNDEARELFAFGLRSSGRTTRAATWVDAFYVRRAADVAEGWPSALTGRWLAELARGTPLFEGLSIDVRVDAGRLAPRFDHASLRLAPPTGAWTFARALFATGGALRLHGRGKNVPFVAHSLPHDMTSKILGEAFAALVEAPVFHARARGVSKAKAEASARRMRATRLLERRHRALRVRLAHELERGRRYFLDAFADLASDALCGDAPKELASLLGAPGPGGPAEDAAHFAAFDKGDALANDLVQRFDVDWWRNPKAAAWVRDFAAR